MYIAHCNLHSSSSKRFPVEVYGKLSCELSGNEQAYLRHALLHRPKCLLLEEHATRISEPLYSVESHILADSSVQSKTKLIQQLQEDAGIYTFLRVQQDPVITTKLWLTCVSV